MVFAFLGTTEIIIILVIALLVFGPQKLPEIGKQVGTAMRELNKVRNDVQRALDLDELTGNNHYDSYNSYGTYDNNTAGSSPSTSNALPAYDSPQGVTHAASPDAYESHFDVAGDMRPFVAPPGPQAASVTLSTPPALMSGETTETTSPDKGTV